MVSVGDLSDAVVAAFAVVVGVVVVVDTRSIAFLLLALVIELRETARLMMVVAGLCSIRRGSFFRFPSAPSVASDAGSYSGGYICRLTDVRYEVTNVLRSQFSENFTLNID